MYKKKERKKRSNLIHLKREQHQVQDRDNPGFNKKRKSSLISIWYTKADTLTQAEIHKLKEEIKSSTPDVIAIVEIKPKNYTRELSKTEYNIEGYRFEPANLEDKGSSRGVALYVHKSLIFSKLDTNKIIGNKADAPKEEISIELSNIYRNPSSDGKADEDIINNFFRSTGKIELWTPGDSRGF